LMHARGLLLLLLEVLLWLVLVLCSSGRLGCMRRGQDDSGLRRWGGQGGVA